MNLETRIITNLVFSTLLYYEDYLMGSLHLKDGMQYSLSPHHLRHLPKPLLKTCDKALEKSKLDCNVR